MQGARNWRDLSRQLVEDFGIDRSMVMEDEATSYMLFRHLRGEELGDPADPIVKAMLWRLVLAYSDLAAACRKPLRREEMKGISIADSRAYASRIVDRLTDEGVFGDNETLRHNNVRIIAEELLEIFGKQSDD